MARPDPFTDPAFVSRLQKLLPMLGSAQGGEAEAARRKLMEHLSQANLSLLDLAQRLQGPPPRNPYGQSPREEALERQLALARAARDEAAGEARRLGQYLQTAQIEMEQARFEAGAILQAQGRTRAVAITGWIAAVFCLGLAVFVPKAEIANPAMVTQERVYNAANPPTLGQEAAPARLNASELAGTTAVQDTPIRLGPSDAATIRAFLNIGEHVAILQQARVGPQTWLLIRSASGTGWARSGDILH